MIDLDAIKAGDLVMIHVHANSHCHAQEDGVKVEVFDGDVFCVDEPPTSEDRRHVHLKHIAFPKGFFSCFPEHCHAASMQDKQSTFCTCDIMMLMRCGCQCGYLATEREAQRA